MAAARTRMRRITGAERGISLGIVRNMSRITISFGRRVVAPAGLKARTSGHFWSFFDAGLEGPPHPFCFVAECSLRSLDRRGGCPHMDQSQTFRRIYLRSLQRLNAVPFR